MAITRFNAFLFLQLLLLTGTSLVHASPSTDPAWTHYRDRFITHDGRVLDTGNGNVSHSEGQGWGMLLAVAYNDRATFDRLWRWTQTNLGRDDLALFSWRYDPRNYPPVSDRNNATDGDLFIAWALQLAAERWHHLDYALNSIRIRRTIAAGLVRKIGGYWVLLPGLNGFLTDDYVDINLSYWFMPALKHFAQLEPQHNWALLVEDGRRLLQDARFGSHDLPSDWIRLDHDGRLTPSPKWPTRFGFDAVRVPLYFAWAQGADDNLAAFRKFWNDPRHQPPAAWIDLRSGERAPYAASNGVLAIRSLVNGNTQQLPVPAAHDDYYAATLLMLVRASSALTPKAVQPALRP